MGVIPHKYKTNAAGAEHTVFLDKPHFFVLRALVLLLPEDGLKGPFGTEIIQPFAQFRLPFQPSDFGLDPFAYHHRDVDRLSVESRHWPVVHCRTQVSTGQNGSIPYAF